MRRFYAPPENFRDKIITLGNEETKHLCDVLRLREGAEVYVFDGFGSEFRCKIALIEKRETKLDILEKVAPKSPESRLKLTLGVALLKGEKFDLIVQKSCELGVFKIVPLLTKRADVKIKDAREGKKKLERWQKIALEAAKQSGRAKLMRIDAPVLFEKFIESSNGIKILFSEGNGESFENAEAENVSEITAVIGSEGGWENAEIEAARAKNFQITTLGGRILRAETAVIVVAALLQNHFGDLK